MIKKTAKGYLDFVDALDRAQTQAKTAAASFVGPFWAPVVSRVADAQYQVGARQRAAVRSLFGLDKVEGRSTKKGTKKR